MAIRATNATNNKVKVTIPFDRNATDDVYVAVNGKGMLIKRGVEVEIPKAYAEVLERSNQAKMEYLQAIRELHDSQPD